MSGSNHTRPPPGSIPTKEMAMMLSAIEGTKEFCEVCNLDFLVGLTDAGRSMIENGSFLRFLINHPSSQCMALVREVNSYFETKEVIYAASHPEEWKADKAFEEKLRREAEGYTS